MRFSRTATGFLLGWLVVQTGAFGAGRPTPDFDAGVQRHAQATTDDRRWLHANPELSLREHRTQAFLVEKLSGIDGVELVPGDWQTGAVALLRGGQPGPVVAYRADMDGLPLTEATGLPFASTRTDSLDGRPVGVMHACGHDLHAAILLGTARVLSEARAEMPGSVLFVLEPAEEIGAGARMLLDAGLFEGGRRPIAIFGIHDHPTIPFGSVGYCPGRSTANVDDFRILVRGEGGHGAYPHKANDPIVTAAGIVLALQSIVSREVDASRQAVVTVGSIHGGTTSNVIPEVVELHGTVRTLDPDVRQQVHEALIRTAKGIASAHGSPEPEIRYGFGTPSMYNDPGLVEMVLPALRRVVGEDRVLRYDPAMGGEDFSQYQIEVPGFMFRLGVGREDRSMTLHSPTFDPDERAIPLAMRLMAEILWEQLHRGLPADPR